MFEPLLGREALKSRDHCSERLLGAGTRGLGALPGSQDPDFVPGGTCSTTGLLPCQAVAQILPFRDQNREALDGLWNRHHVERVEVILKETVDAEGAWVGLLALLLPCVR